MFPLRFSSSNVTDIVDSKSKYGAKVVFIFLMKKQIDRNLQYAEGGGIHIKPSKRGTFTAAATKHGMGV